MLKKLVFSVLFLIVIGMVIQPSFGLTKDEIVKLNAKSIGDRVSGGMINKTQSVKPLNQTKQAEPIPDDSTIKKLEIKNKRMELKELLKSFKKQDIDRTEFLQRYAVLRAQINSLTQ